MNKRFQILSLDGGGIKGIFSAAILAAIEDDLGVRITDHFDLIVGTSTGGIIALGLGLGLTPLEILDFYYEHGPDIFRQRNLRALRHPFRNKYADSALRVALQDNEVFGGNLLGDSNKSLVIPSYSLVKNDVYLFKTDHHDRFVRDWKVPAWQVALATCAAPTYFPAASHIANLRHVDGGVWANNPIMVGLTEAVAYFDCQLEDIRILSLGTTNYTHHHHPKRDSSGWLLWLSDMKNIFLRGQTLGSMNQAIHLLRADSVLRIDPDVSHKLYGLDKPKYRADLVARAACESRSQIPFIEKGFKDHIAPPRYSAYRNQINDQLLKEQR